MKLSVIIPAHNREAYIESAVRSLLHQRDAAALDIIVIDDGSTDGTADVVTALQATAPCLRLIRQPKAGVAPARNAGLRHVPRDADLVTFLDSDDVSLPNRFATEVPLFREEPDLAMTYSLMTLADEIDGVTLAPTAAARTCTMRGISLTTAIFRKDTIDALGAFDERLEHAEDWDFLLRFFESGRPYRLLDHVGIVYRRHPGNMTLDRDTGRRSFMQAMLLSAQRRRRNPVAVQIPRFFDFSLLADEQNASLR